MPAPPKGAPYDSALWEGCLQQRLLKKAIPITVPSERASCNSAPLEGGILKPPALRVVVD